MEQTRLLREVERHTDAEHSYMDDGIRLLELARNAGALFARQAPPEKKRLLNLVLSNCEWRLGEISAVCRQLFGLLAETVAIAAAEKSHGAKLSTGHTGWLMTQSKANPSPWGFSLLTGKRTGKSRKSMPPKPNWQEILPQKQRVDEAFPYVA